MSVGASGPHQRLGCGTVLAIGSTVLLLSACTTAPEFPPPVRAVYPEVICPPPGGWDNRWHVQVLCGLRRPELVASAPSASWPSPSVRTVYRPVVSRPAPLPEATPEPGPQVSSPPRPRYDAPAPIARMSSYTPTRSEPLPQLAAPNDIEVERSCGKWWRLSEIWCDR